MYILTADGWRTLLRTVTRIEEAPPRWRKSLPSAECLAFIAANEKAHAEWVALRASLQKEAA